MTMPGEYAAGPLPRAATCCLGCDEDRIAMRLAPAACCDAVLAAGTSKLPRAPGGRSQCGFANNKTVSCCGAASLSQLWRCCCCAQVAMRRGILRGARTEGDEPRARA